MLKISSQTPDVSNLLASYINIDESLANTASEPLARMFTEIAQTLSTRIQNNFDQQGALTTPWRPPGYLTKLLRKRTGSPFQNEQEFLTATQNTPALIATGSLRASFQTGHAKNIQRITADGLEYGSTDPRASFLHHGGNTQITQQYQITRTATGRKRYIPIGENARRLEQNVAKRSSTGRWNPWFFRLRAILAKASRRTFKVPARPILPEAQHTAHWEEALTPVFAKHLDKLLSNESQTDAGF